MLTLSYLFLILGGLLLLGLGWFLNHFLYGSKSKDWKERYDQMSKDFDAQAKKLKKETKSSEQFKAKAESWKHEYQELTQVSKTNLKAEQATSMQHQETIKALNADLEKLKRDHASVTTFLERSKKDQEKLKEKYSKEVLAFKDWASTKSSLESEVKDLKTKLDRQLVISKEYQGKYEKQAEQINGIRVLERELRMLKTKSKKLNEDVTYWEKKHYDTHHELAKMKQNSESLVNKYSELEQLRKGDEVLKSNLMDQIQEFKTKFVNINNKYRDMVNSNN